MCVLIFRSPLPPFSLLLQVALDPAKRLSADACLKHPWLNTAERRPSTDRPPTSPTFFVEALERIRGINADRSNSHSICVFLYW
jgi:hypothetical protein